MIRLRMTKSVVYLEINNSFAHNDTFTHITRKVLVGMNFGYGRYSGDY
jgi:hypothetical protein